MNSANPIRTSLADKLKSMFASKWAWILVAFLIGLDLGWQAHREWGGKAGEWRLPFLPDVHFNYHSDFGSGAGSGDSEGDSEANSPQDSFEDMRRMQEKMLRQFGGLSGPRGFQGHSIEAGSGSFKEREDDKFVYYDLEFGGQTPSNLQVKVEDGQVAISGSLEKKDEASGSFVSSSFQRSFPVPANVIAEKFELEQDGGKIVIKFPKR